MEVLKRSKSNFFTLKQHFQLIDFLKFTKFSRAVWDRPEGTHRSPNATQNSTYPYILLTKTNIEKKIEIDIPSMF